MGNTHEQLFHAWLSFTFDENTETIDSCVIQIRQVATLLGYGEPQILEVFKNTLPTTLYWILFPIEDLRQAVDTAKRILTKEKVDRQITDQTSTSPFMSVRDGTERRVPFNTRDELGDKIDKLTVVMSKQQKTVMKESLSNHKYTKAEVRIDPMAREVTKTGRIVEIGDISQIIVQDRIIEVTILEEMLEGIVDRIIEETTEIIEKDHSQEITITAVIEAQAIVDQDQGLEQIQIEIG